MTFSRTVKAEILKNKPKTAALRRMQCFGLMLFARAFDSDDMTFVTEHRTIARLYVEYIAELMGENIALDIKETPRSGGEKLYTVSAADTASRLAVTEFFRRETSVLTPRSPKEDAMFLSGAFLACGTVSDPAKEYRLEFVLAREELEDMLLSILENIVDEPRRTVRRGNRVLYYKESEQIEDILTAVGCSGAALAVMETKIFKDFRNRANRVTNCETANIEKTVAASVDRCESIRVVYEKLGEESLPDDLRDIARMRVENPEMSLRELGDSLTPPLSRSGVHHRLKRLDKIAEELLKD